MGNYLGNLNATEVIPAVSNFKTTGEMEKENEKFNTPLGFRHLPKSMDPRSPSEGIGRTPLLVKESPVVAVDSKDVISLADPRSPSHDIDRTPLVFKTENLEFIDSSNVEEVVEPLQEKKALVELFNNMSLGDSIKESLDSDDGCVSMMDSHQMSDSLRVEPPTLADRTFSELETENQPGGEKSVDLSEFPDSILTSTPIKLRKKPVCDKENSISTGSGKNTPQPYKRTPLADKKQNIDSPRFQLQNRQRNTARVLMQRNSD